MIKTTSNRQITLMNHDKTTSNRIITLMNHEKPQCIIANESTSNRV